MHDIKNNDVAELLENIADMLEIKGDSIFRVRAYRDASRQIESLTEDIEDIVQKGELCDIPGIGEGLAGRIKEYVETGRSSYYEDLRKEINPGLADLLEVPGIGPKKAKLFYEQLGIDSVDSLEKAAKEHRLSTIPKIGPKTEQNILDSIERMRGRSERTPLGIALPAAREFLQMIRDFPEVSRADLAGSLRRMQDTIGDLDLLAASDNPEAVIDRFTKLPDVRSILVKGPTKGTIVTREHLQIDLRVLKPDEYGAGLQYFTGSKMHNIKFRTLAVNMGLKVSEYGIFRVSDGERIAGETEEGMYETLGLQWMSPELREDRGEIEAAQSGRLPKLVQVSDLKGDLHVHTNWSDGSDPPEAMVEAAVNRGYEYIVFSDHSVSMAFVNGLTPERILEQRALVDRLNEKYPGIRILHAIEVNIRADGSLDYEDDVISQFDVVTASVHSGMGMPRDKMTERIIRAVRNPYVDILGHPTGRIIGRRDPYEVDMDAVLRAASDAGTAMEINSQPDRLDLKDTDARMAKDLGVMVAIDSDSHAANQLGIVEYGIATARRGWIEPENVLNALPLHSLLSYLQRKRPVRRAA
ncbi:MAG: DNA polymerase/3'-5' exonuclease PolX [Armatimonadota bacterium]